MVLVRVAIPVSLLGNTFHTEVGTLSQPEYPVLTKWSKDTRLANGF